MGGAPCQKGKTNAEARGVSVVDMGSGAAWQRAAAVALSVLTAAGQHTLGIRSATRTGWHLLG